MRMVTSSNIDTMLRLFSRRSQLIRKVVRSQGHLS